MHRGIGGDGMIGALHWAHERMCSVFLDGEGTETSKTERQNFQSIESTRCLLYTSPSPRDRTRSRMPSSA